MIQDLIAAIKEAVREYRRLRWVRQRSHIKTEF